MIVQQTKLIFWKYRFWNSRFELWTEMLRCLRCFFDVYKHFKCKYLPLNIDTYRWTFFLPLPTVLQEILEWKISRILFFIIRSFRKICPRKFFALVKCRLIKFTPIKDTFSKEIWCLHSDFIVALFQTSFGFLRTT